MTTTDLQLYFIPRYMGPFPAGAETLPASLTPAPWMHITNLPQFVETNLIRLESDSQRLRTLAEQNLKALHRSLTTAHTQPSTT